MEVGVFRSLMPIFIEETCKLPGLLGGKKRTFKDFFFLILKIIFYFKSLATKNIR